MGDKLYCDVDGVTTPLSADVTISHSSSMSIATVSCINTTLDIGDAVNVYLGYEGNYEKVFKGYVKIIERKIPDNTYTITMYDLMTRAIDYFIASSTPDNPFTRSSILAENLVREIMQLAGLAGAGKWIYDGTSFVLGNVTDVVVNLATVYDYCKTIADALTWSIWADQDGAIHFENRKPYVMGANPGQPGWDTDLPGNVANETDPFEYSDATDITYRRNEKDLRNRVVVYGGNNVSATAEAESAWLPAGFRKSVVAAFQFIDTTERAQDIADYNLELLNKLTKELIMTVVGDPSLTARVVYKVSEDFYNTVVGDGDYADNTYWYGHTVQHSWSQSGYTTNLTLRRGVTA